jgi:hypothetical protein
MVCGPHTAADAPLPAKKGSKRYSRQDQTPSTPRQPAGPMGEKTAWLDSDGVHRYEFGSIGEAVETALTDFAQTAQSRTTIQEGLEAHGFWKGNGDRWTNHFSAKKFLAEIANPSAHLLEAVDAMRARLTDDIDAPTAPRRRVRHGQESGEELDADRVLARIPEAWDRNVREPQPTRNVTIGCNLSVNCHIKPEQLLYRGAAALALADVLTARGFNVEIVLFDARRDGSDQVGRSVCKYVAKDLTMPLDVPAVAFAMCEIAWFRIVGAYGFSRHMPGNVTEYLGSAMSLPEADRKGVHFLIDSDVLSREAAEDWLKRCIRRSEVQSESEAA